jgi:hypothetical protein
MLSNFFVSDGGGTSDSHKLSPEVEGLRFLVLSWPELS